MGVCVGGGGLERVCVGGIEHVCVVWGGLERVSVCVCVGGTNDHDWDD